MPKYKLYGIPKIASYNEIKDSNPILNIVFNSGMCQNLI